MGIYDANPAHFLDWLTQNPDRWKSEFPSLSVHEYSTPPRRLYGIYLENMAASLKEKAERYGMSLKYIYGEVIDLDTVNGTFRLASGKNITADIAVFALGAFPSTAFSYLEGLNGYFASPFPEERLIQGICKQCVNRLLQLFFLLLFLLSLLVVLDWFSIGFYPILLWFFDGC